ncbi:hypothetical protein D3C87_1358500 [compost metagenome]
MLLATTELLSVIVTTPGAVSEATYPLPVAVAPVCGFRVVPSTTTSKSYTPFVPRAMSSVKLTLNL